MRTINRLPALSDSESNTLPTRNVADILDSYGRGEAHDDLILLTAIQSATVAGIKAAKSGRADELNGIAQRIEAMASRLHSIAKRQSL